MSPPLVEKPPGVFSHAPAHRRRHLSRSDWGLVALALLTVVATVWGLGQHPAAPPPSMGPTPWTDAFSKPAASEIAPLASMDATIARLKDASRPWTMAVLGDSTGNEDSEWVHLLTVALIEKTGRPAEVHTWSVDNEAYGMPTRYAGEGQPIIVWNGSAAGKHTGYSLDHRHHMVPERPDLLILNHGHNQVDVHETSEEVRSIALWARKAWSEPPALAVTLQNSRTDARADEHARLVARLRQDVQADGAATIIDVFSMFEASQNISVLLRPDGFHPSVAGEALWMDVVWRSLGLHALFP